MTPTDQGQQAPTLLGWAGEKHIAGPWLAVRDDDEGWRIYGTTPSGMEGCYQVAVVIDGNGNKQNAANKDLITAAPELLEALIKVVKYADSEPDGGDTVEMHRANIEKARAAIAKAQGGTQ